VEVARIDWVLLSHPPRSEDFVLSKFHRFWPFERISGRT